MSQRARLRLVVLRVLMLSLLISLIGRLYFIQVVDQYQFKKIVEAQITDTILTAPIRGQILDAQGRPLASNRSELVIFADAGALSKQKDLGQATLTRLAGLLAKPYNELVNSATPCQKGTHQGCWQGDPRAPIPIATNISTPIAQRIVEHLDDFPGLSVAPMPVRHYDAPAGVNAAQLLGYLQPVTHDELKTPRFANYDARELVGRTGLENEYEGVLAGTAGVQNVSLDPSRHVIGTISATPPVPGDNLVLSIDAQVQALAEKTLADAVAADARIPKDLSGPSPKGLSVADKGAAVVYDSKTGRIMALATYPKYNPSLWIGNISTKDFTALNNARGHPLNNYAVSGAFPPGSTFKLVTTVGAIDDGLTAFDGSKPVCTAQEKVGNQIFHNYEGVGLGKITLHEVIVQSCDTTFYQWAKAEYKADEDLIAAHKQPKETQAKMARIFGFGAPTGVDLPGETAGTIDDRAIKRATWAKMRAYYCMLASSAKQTPYQRAIAADHCSPQGGNFNPGDQANFNIGQGTVLATPLQIATAYGALINGGTLYSPTLGWGVLGPDGKPKHTIVPQVRGKLGVSASTLQGIQDAMCEVPRRGTAKQAYADFDFSKVTVCGKTGTAQTTVDRDDTSWFASFGGPVADPKRYVVVVVIPDGGHGADAAAPATRKIWEGMFGLAGKTPMQFATKLPTFRPDGKLAHTPPNVTVTPCPTALASPSGSASATPTSSPTPTGLPTPGSSPRPQPCATPTGSPTGVSPTGVSPIGASPGTTPTPTGTSTTPAAAGLIGIAAPILFLDGRLRWRRRRRRASQQRKDSSP